MENVNMSEYQQAQQGLANLAKNGSTYNNFFSTLLGGDATYSSLENLQASKMQNAFNSAEAAKSRNWQEYMSNTANQRAVADLQKAGFSPLALLGNSSSASTPSGATATGGSGTGGSSGSKSADMMKGIMSTILMLGMSSANLKTKMNIAQADRLTKTNINSANMANKLEISERANESKRLIAESANQAKKDIARMASEETVDTIKTKHGYHTVKRGHRF